MFVSRSHKKLTGENCFQSGTSIEIVKSQNALNIGRLKMLLGRENCRWLSDLWKVLLLALFPIHGS